MSKRSGIYLFFLSALGLFSYFLPQATISKTILLFLIIAATLPVWLVIHHLKQRKILYFAFLIILLLSVASGLTFRVMRDTLPPPLIENYHIVGFTQYFGYPLFLDSFLFFVFLSTPVLFFVALYLWELKFKKKK